MEEKLRILMKNENLTASRLAEILEVQPAVISHLLRGRNKPSFELVCKLVTRFPKINPYWLLGDDEQIYSSNSATLSASSQESSSLSSGPSAEATLFDVVNAHAQQCDKSNILGDLTASFVGTRPASEIEKVLIIYRDKTFEELRSR